jgi:hypothetical protein
MLASTRRGKPSRPRVLYWYRSPPGVKVGRPPFDEEVRRTLEAANPGVVFDWPSIIATPMPAPDPAETWRERRRLEKLAKQARRQEEARAAEIQPESATGQADAVGPMPEPGERSPVGGGTPPVETGQEGVRPAGARRRRRGGRRRRDQVGSGRTVAQPQGPSSGMSEALPARSDVDRVAPATPNPPDREHVGEAPGPDSDDV